MSERLVEHLRVRLFPDERALARAAAEDAATALRSALEARERARVLFASGNSQLAFLAELAASDDVDWGRVVGFHMDDYVGIEAGHPASFRRYMREHVVERLRPADFHFIEGDAPDAGREAERYSTLLGAGPIDLCCLGIGENGHLAFNDPPVADFDDPVDVKVVALEARSRRQQVGEGHFESLEAVPETAITVTIPALVRARRVLAIVPEARKAEPVARALEGPVSTECPASILRRQAHATLYLDRDSASGLADPP